MYWSSNVFNISSAKGGSGTQRQIRIGNDLSPAFNIFNAGMTVNSLSFKAYIDAGGSATIGGSVFSHNSTGSSGVQYGVYIFENITQTSTAGYTAFTVNAKENTTGSGAKLLADLQVSGTSKFKIDNAGNTFPATDSASTLGTSALYWSNAYTDRMYLNSTAYIDGATAGVLTMTNKVNMGTVQMMYLPDQTNFAGTSYYGNGGGSLSHSSGSQGFDNTLVGIDAGLSMTTGSQNLAFGSGALRANTTGSNNFAFGFHALYSPSTASNNMAIGIYSLNGVSSGAFNLGIGYNALGSVTSTSASVGIGNEALQNTNSSVLTAATMSSSGRRLDETVTPRTESSLARKQATVSRPTPTQTMLQ
jgi:hypothetical protein